jgi:hypothetical protein
MKCRRIKIIINSFKEKHSNERKKKTELKLAFVGKHLSNKNKNKAVKFELEVVILKSFDCFLSVVLRAEFEFLKLL